MSTGHAGTTGHTTSGPIGVRIVHEAFDVEDAQRLRAAARVETDHAVGMRSDVGLPLVAAMVAVHIVARDHFGVALGCAGLVAAGDGVYEIRRLYVRPDVREHGIGGMMVRELETSARELGAPALVIETASILTHVIESLERKGFSRIAPFGPYAGNPGSVCLAKTLS
jgi:GNAT superfamily N-acetyltransferase